MKNKRPFTFGIESLEKDYKTLKQIIQCPQVYRTVRKSVVNNACSWVSQRWNKNVDYNQVLLAVGVSIVED